jgi:regulator of replication initiation timing
MEDRAILLKIRRQFKKDESINALLKIISELRVEVGMQKSEIQELKQDVVALSIENNKLKSRPTESKSKKQWRKDEIMAIWKDELIKKDDERYLALADLRKYQ